MIGISIKASPVPWSATARQTLKAFKALSQETSILAICAGELEAMSSGSPQQVLCLDFPSSHYLRKSMGDNMPSPLPCRRPSSPG